MSPMPLFAAAPMYLAPAPTTARRYRGGDFAQADPGYGARYARRPAPPPAAATVITWPGATLARIGDAWVLQDCCARAA